MPEMTPVATQIRVPDASQGINTLSGILGLKQQRQALQGQSAQVQQEQLKAQQAQSVQNFFKDFSPSDHVSNDGTLDLDSALQDPKFKAAGNAKPLIMQSLLDVKNHQLASKQALSSLNKDLVNQFGTALGALAGDEDVKTDQTDPTTGVNAGRAKVNQFIQNFSKLSPDAARVAQIYGGITQHAPPGKLGKGIAALQLQAQSASEQQAQQNPVPGMLSTGARDILTTTNRATGIQTPTGQIVSRETPPTIVTTPAGPLARVEGGGSTITPLQTAPTQPNLNLTRPQVEAQTGLARDVTARVSQATTAANSSTQAQDALMRAKAILEAPEGPNTGAAFDSTRKIKNYLASVGVDTGATTDMNSLVKNLARYEAARATQAGLGGTDAARELAHNGSPNAQVDKNALVGIVNQSLATEKAISAYAAKQSKTNDPEEMRKIENEFRNIPHLIEAYEYGMARTPQEAEHFLAKHGVTREQMKEARQKIKAFESR